MIRLWLSFLDLKGLCRVQLVAWRNLILTFRTFVLIGWSSVVGYRLGFVRRWGLYVGWVVRLVWSYIHLVNEEARDTTKLVAIIEKAFEIR